MDYSNKRIELLNGIMWDYQISGEDCLDVLMGKKPKIAHYTQQTIFIKLIESYRWFTVLKILPPKRILELLTDQTIARLRFKSLRDQYTFIRNGLQKAL